MAVRMDKPWRALSADEVAGLSCNLGVYQLADASGEIVKIGVAGGRSAFGLRGELEQALAAPPSGATQFRIEVNMAYRTRHFELLQAYLSDHQRLPPANSEDPSRLGRIRPG